MHRRSLLRVWLCVAAVATSVAFAPLTAATDEYRIRPGDRLRIDVLSRPEYSQLEAVVRPDGKLNYFFGDIDANGLTIDDLRALIQTELGEHFSDPEVLVSPVPHENQVFVGGEVAKPGRYPFEEEAISIEAALILGGGPLPESADVRSVYHLPRGAQAARYDVTSPFVSAVEVQGGDVVYVSAKTRVTVSGNVQQAGVYHFLGSVSVGQALAIAGGAVDDQGDLSRVVVVRSDGEIVTFDAGQEFWRGASDGSPALRHGDAVYVPNAYQVEEISVLGHVHAPGVYRVRGPVTISRALALAGGADVDEAAVSRLEVSRLDGTRESIDLNARAGILLFPGETLRVPKRLTINWSLMVSFISTAAVLVSLFR